LLLWVGFRNVKDQRRLRRQLELILVNAGLLLCELGLIALVGLIAE
jgi:hypothetical protein